jgi:molybdopterin synthase catalytic subunit
MIKIQQESFDLEREINSIKFKHENVGAVSTFIGYVRDINNNKKVTSIDLEVYREMAFNSLEKICKEAQSRWDLIDNLVIHRYGRLEVNEKIVLVATFSMHRSDSILSCNYIMDYLKKNAPFWKKEFYNENFKWL